MAVNAEFKRLWDLEIKPTAVECTKLLKEMEAEDKRIASLSGAEQEAAIAEAQAKYAGLDPHGMQIISSLIFAVEHDLADDRIGLNCLNLVMQVAGTLNPTNASYWTNVWGNDFSSETGQNFRKFGEQMQQLQAAM